MYLLLFLFCHTTMALTTPPHHFKQIHSFIFHSPKPHAFVQPQTHPKYSTRPQPPPSSTTAIQSTPTTTIPISISALKYITASILGGTLGTPLVIRATQSWYNQIALPPWTPPKSLFAPVWTILYGLMGYAAHRIQSLSNTSKYACLALKVALGHYALNLLWAPVFFGFKRLRAGHVLNVILLMSLLGVMGLFSMVDVVAMGLLVPYLLWLGFATRLSSEIARLNPTKGGYNDAMWMADLGKLQKEAAERV